MTFWDALRFNQMAPWRDMALAVFRNFVPNNFSDGIKSLKLKLSEADIWSEYLSLPFFVNVLEPDLVRGAISPIPKGVLHVKPSPYKEPLSESASVIVFFLNFREISSILKKKEFFEFNYTVFQGFAN